MNEWEELDVHEVFRLINNNVPNPSPKLRDQLYGLITETQDLVIEINEEPRQTELEEAVLAEREACAKVCEAMADKRFGQAALRIRARGET
jgi:hypothetical protein